MSEAVKTLTADIRAYEDRKAELEATHMGKWVVFYNAELIDIYESFDIAAREAVAKFGRGPYLIRQVGASSVTLPASVMYRVA